MILMRGIVEAYETGTSIAFPSGGVGNLEIAKLLDESTTQDDPTLAQARHFSSNTKVQGFVRPDRMATQRILINRGCLFDTPYRRSPTLMIQAAAGS